MSVAVINKEQNSVEFYHGDGLWRFRMHDTVIMNAEFFSTDAPYKTKIKGDLRTFDILGDSLYLSEAEYERTPYRKDRFKYKEIKRIRFTKSFPFIKLITVGVYHVNKGRISHEKHQKVEITLTNANITEYEDDGEVREANV